MFKLTTKWYCIINKQYSQRKEEQIAHKYARFRQGLHESSKPKSINNLYPLSYKMYHRLP